MVFHWSLLQMKTKLLPFRPISSCVPSLSSSFYHHWHSTFSACGSMTSSHVMKALDLNWNLPSTAARLLSCISFRSLSRLESTIFCRFFFSSPQMSTQSQSYSANQPSKRRVKLMSESTWFSKVEWDCDRLFVRWSVKWKRIHWTTHKSSRPAGWPTWFWFSSEDFDHLTYAWPMSLRRLLVGQLDFDFHLKILII